VSHSVNGGGANTLDEAYDEGGPGAGGTICADYGPVQTACPVAANGTLLFAFAGPRCYPFTNSAA
jgi:hypothetical protein